MKRHLVAVSSGAMLLIAGPLATSASAESYSAHCAVNFVGANNCTADGTGHGAAYAQYDDDPDLISITDDLGDGHSAVVEYWPEGQSGQKRRVWVRSGQGTSNSDTISGLPENASYKMHACIGEWADDPAKRVVLDCGSTKSIYL